MRTLKLTVAYDGRRYAGWQIQQARSQTSDRRRHPVAKPTIQGTLETVLERILQEPVQAIGSGRTDAGVHAIAQVAHLKTRSALSSERLLRSLNHLLPSDIAVSSVEEAPPSFHARFDAVGKRYRYRIFTGAVVPPFIRAFVHHVRAPLRLGLMRQELSAFTGAHDFRAFARSGGVLRHSTRRTITGVALTRRDDEVWIDVEGDGFLHTMVRSLVGTLIDVGRGRLPRGTVTRMLRTGSRALAGATAPAQGLALMQVHYEPARAVGRSSHESA